MSLSKLELTLQTWRVEEVYIHINLYSSMFVEEKLNRGDLQPFVISYENIIEVSYVEKFKI